MLAPVETTTVAVPNCEPSSLLIARTWMASGVGGAVGAV